MKPNIQQMTGGRAPFGCRAGLRLLLFMVLGCLLVMAPATTAAQSDEQQTQDLIRSAMIFNFCKFVEWPENTLGDSIVLGVVGDPESIPDFSSIQGQTVQNLPLTVRPVKNPEDLRQCQVVYIATGQEKWAAENLPATAESSILTISDQEDFCNGGGIIQLVERRGKLRFFINRKAAGRAHLDLSSQLLKVAKIVEGN